MRSMYAVLSPESKHRLCSSKVHSSTATTTSPPKDQRKPSPPQQQRVASRKKCRRVFRIRMRVAARLHFLERLRQMCLRLVLGSGKNRCRNVCDSPKPDHRLQHRHNQQQQESSCVRSSYCEDAVAECIKFIKQTAVPAADSRSIIS